MSYHSGDDQSEDGELRQSPINRRRQEMMDFSLSEDDDSLDIKPPQARLAPSSTGSAGKRREGRPHHKHYDRHRTAEEPRHRGDKHHKKPSASSSSMNKERHYREQAAENQYYRDRAVRGDKSRQHKSRGDKRRGRHEGEDKRDRAEKTLHDLRERLLSKRKGDHSSSRYQDPEDSALQGEAGMYVKEIINIASDSDSSKRHRRRGDDFEATRGGLPNRLMRAVHDLSPPPETAVTRLTDEERIAQEMRKEKLLEAEREMARMKENSRVERERRHLEKRKKEEIEFYYNSKKPKVEGVVTVSDNTDESSEAGQEDDVEEDDEEEEEEEEEDEQENEVEADEGNNRSEDSHSSRSHRSTTESRSRSRSTSSDRSDGSVKNGHRDEEPEQEENVEREGEEGKKEEGDEVPKSKIDDDLPPYYPAVQGCRSVEEFQCLNRIEEGTYGVVYRAKDKRTEDIVALKRLKMEKEKEGFPITSLREINTLLKGQHPNIVTVREIVVGSNMDKIFIVMDYVEHDLKSLMETMKHKKQNFTAGEVKCLLKQLLLAVSHLHDNWILHRDLKTSNLLLSHKGILKVGDFGLAREYGSPLKPYTAIVVTLWYRAPELLLCVKEYSTPIDMWSVGCIFAELLLMNAVFPGKSEVDQLNRIFKDLGTPSEKIWPGYNKLPAVQKMKFAEYPVSNLRHKFQMLTELGLGMLTKFLTYDPVQRVSAEDALQHPFFNEAPLPIDPAMFPTWPAKSELGQKRALAASPKPPSGGGEYKRLGGDVDPVAESDDSYGFRISGVVDTRRMGFNLRF